MESTIFTSLKQLSLNAHRSNRWAASSGCEPFIVSLRAWLVRLFELFSMEISGNFCGETLTFWLFSAKTLHFWLFCWKKSNLFQGFKFSFFKLGFSLKKARIRENWRNLLENCWNRQESNECHRISHFFHSHRSVWAAYINISTQAFNYSVNYPLFKCSHAQTDKHCSNIWSGKVTDLLAECTGLSCYELSRVYLSKKKFTDFNISNNSRCLLYFP